MNPESLAPTKGQAKPCAQDKEQAHRYVEALTGSPDSALTFQVFGDHENAPIHPTVFHGTLDEHWPDICDLNDSGAGIFVTVNETDGKGRKAENVVALRALVADDDNGTLDPTTLAVPPSMVVESSPGKLHAYWKLDPGEPLDSFTPMQSAIAERLGTDRTVKDLSRVLRLPGTIHGKDPSRPHLVRIASCEPTRRYRGSEVVEGLGTSVPAAAPPSPADTGGSLPVASRRLLATGTGEASPIRRAQAFADSKAALVKGEGIDNAAVGLAANMVRGFALSDADALPVCESWGNRCTPPVPRDLWLSKYLPNAHKHIKQPIGDLLNQAPLGGAAPRPYNQRSAAPGASSLSAKIHRFTEQELSEEPPPRRFIWEHRIPVGKVGTICAAGGAGKSAITTGLAIHRALGLPFLGKPTLEGHTAILTAEDDREDYRGALWAWKTRMGSAFDVRLVNERVSLIDVVGHPFQLIEPPDPRSPLFQSSIYVPELIATLRDKLPDVDLLIVETLIRMGGDEGGPAMRALIAAGEEIRRATGAAVAFVHHTGKANAARGATGQYASRGSSALEDNGRFTLNLTRMSNLPPDQVRSILNVKATPAPEKLRALLKMEVAKVKGALDGEIYVAERFPTRHGITVEPYSGTEKEEGDRERENAEARHTMSTRLGDLVARLTDQGEQVTKTTLEGFFKQLGIPKRSLPAAIADAIDDRYLANGGPRQGRGGGLLLLPGTAQATRSGTRPSSTVPNQQGMRGEEEKINSSTPFPMGRSCIPGTPDALTSGLLGGIEVGHA